jgi:DNA-binding NtrC family response regulator
MACILMVEDDEQVRVLAEGVIQSLGHAMLTAGSVGEALALLKGSRAIDLLFVEVRLFDHHFGGLEIAEQARVARPGIRVLYTTAYGINDSTRAQFVEGWAFLPKPYAPEHLAAAIQGALPTRSGTSTRDRECLRFQTGW